LSRSCVACWKQDYVQKSILEEIEGVGNGLRMTELGPLPDEWQVCPIEKVIENITSGDWGTDEPGDGLVAVRAIRGTDFRRAAEGDVTGAPIRHIKPKSVENRRLLPGDALVEISGGSKAQPTGRLLVPGSDLVRSAGLPLCFSNFTKRLRVNTAAVDPDYFGYYWRWLYERGATRPYEKRTTGIRNFKLSDFLENETIILPPSPNSAPSPTCSRRSSAPGRRPRR